MSKSSVLGVLVDAVGPEQARSRIIESAHASHPMAVSALATHGVMTGVDDDVHRYRLNHLDLVVCDGQPVRWMLNWKHSARIKTRVYGPDLMLQLCRRAADEELPIFLFGSTKSVLEQLENRLAELFPRLIIAGSRPSLFRTLTDSEQSQLTREISRSGARMVFVGLGCPRQEIWVYENRNSLQMPLIAVGAAFDFHAGTKLQAPPIVGRLGLEWLFRWVTEPRRLMKRTFLLYPRFVFYVLLELLGLWSPKNKPAQEPTRPVRYG